MHNRRPGTQIKEASSVHPFLEIETAKPEVVEDSRSERVLILEGFQSIYDLDPDAKFEEALELDLNIDQLEDFDD